MKTKLFSLAVLLIFTALHSFGQNTSGNGRASGFNPVINNSGNGFQLTAPAQAFTTDKDDPAAKDIMNNDDVIITGSLGVGFDCVDGEAFGFNTVLLKENNLRIKFDDTSLSAGFAANDWTLIANDAASGGLNYFAIEDATAAVIPFRILAGAPADALYVDSTGSVGFNTAQPALALHTKKGDTPGLRLEQDASSGWTAQSWDIAGNEANFFVRDVTNGSLLPFRIQPGSPSSSISIKADGNVGIGTWSPTEKLDVNGSMKLTAILTAPATPAEGSMYMDGNDHLLKYYNGTQWNTVSPDTDEQDLVAATLTGTTLQIDIENGTSVSVDLYPLIADLEARVTALEATIGMKENSKTTAAISQNSPNPFVNSTTIPYFIPSDVQTASLTVYDVKGVKINEYPINTRGAGNLVISKAELAAGSYFYALILDGAKSESKIMIRVD